jgi:hypothetical protein
VDDAPQITNLQVQFQHFAEHHPWACLAMPSRGPAHIGEAWAVRGSQLTPLDVRLPASPHRRCVVEHLQVLHDQAHKLLMSVLDSSHRIPVEIVQDIREWDQVRYGHGWIRWLQCSTILQHVHWYENYPQVAATALQVLRDHCGPPGDPTQAHTFDSRLRFDETTFTVHLDGTAIRIDHPNAFALYKVLAAQKGMPITRRGLRKHDSRFRGDKTIPRLRGKLPRILRDTVKSSNAGYWLHLPVRRTNPRLTRS